MHKCLLLSAVALAAFSQSADSKRFLVEPGAVVEVAIVRDGVAAGEAGERHVTGTFTLKENADGVDSMSGGACLVFQRASSPRACGKQSDCELRREDGVVTSGYCLGVRGTEARTCWARGESFCLKLPGGITKDAINHLPTVKAFQYGPAEAIRWRVLTCQNLVVRGCATGNPADAVLGPGPIATFRPATTSP